MENKNTKDPGKQWSPGQNSGPQEDQKKEQVQAGNTDQDEALNNEQWSPGQTSGPEAEQQDA